MRIGRYNLRQLLDWATIDRVVVLGALTKMWEILTGPITMLLLAFHFTPEVQGYYYTFGSVLALQIFAEMGLSRVILHFASHEWSKLGLNEYRQITGDEEALSRLASLMRSSLKWFIITGSLLILGLGIGGYIFFIKSPASGIQWANPWFAVCLLTGLSLMPMPVWSLLEGCNQLREVYFFRLIDGVLYSISIWVALILGAGLWILSIALAVRLIWGLLFLRYKYWRVLNQLFSRVIGSFVGWEKEIWPMQWRVGIGMVVGYFCFAFLTPVIFHYHGAVMAGRMGMTLGIMSTLSGMTAIFVLPKAPSFGILIAKKEYKSLDQLFFRTVLVAFGAASLGAITIFALVILFYSLNHPLSLRILPPLPTGLFLIGVVLLQIINPQSLYLRSHKIEPFFGIALINSFLIGSSALVLGSRYGATAIAASYSSIILFFNLPAATIIWYRCRKKWHSDTPDCPDVKAGSRHIV